jgi:hypothetical protein
MRRQFSTYQEAPLTHSLVSDILAEYSRPNDKISEMVRRGELISLRRGMYIPGPELDLPQPHRFVSANNLRGPSYISLETALSYWEMIPERVYEISSVTTRTTRNFDTPIGRFTFQRLPLPYYAHGVQHTQLSPQQYALIASPEKAICDKIILTSGIILRSIPQTMDFLVEDLRMEEEQLQLLRPSLIQSWLDSAPKRSSLQILIHTLERL